MTVGDITKGVLHSMREYSNSGELAEEQDVKDYLISMVPLINVYQSQIATEQNALSGRYDIAQNNPANMLGTDWYEDKVHTNEDVSYEASGPKAYSFQVSGIATIYIEEETSADTWTILETISHTPSEGGGYEQYKNTITASDDSNTIRIRFSGLYRYLYRYIAFFEYPYSSATYVPTYQPYVEYLLPETVFRVRNMERSHPDGQRKAYSDYRIEQHSKSRFTVLIPWKDSGEFIVYYYTYPEIITEPSISNLTEQDDTELDLPDEWKSVLIDRITSNLLSDESARRSEKFNASFQEGMNIRSARQQPGIGQKQIVNKGNW